MGEELVAFEVGSGELLLEFCNVCDQIAEALALGSLAGKYNVSDHDLPEETLTLCYCDIGPGVLVGLPCLLKSVLKSIQGHNDVLSCLFLLRLSARWLIGSSSLFSR